MPEEGVNLTHEEKLLTFEERKQLISLFQNLGMTKVRFTGGEPTVSNQLIPLIAHAKSTGFVNSIGITTNGVKLQDQLSSLMEAGLTSVNISLDTFDSKRFSSITRRNPKVMTKVISSIFAAQAAKISLKINCVVMRGINDDEMGNFVKFALQHNITTRFIEVMPFDGNNWNAQQFVGYHEILDRLRIEHVSNSSNLQVLRL
jgi:molybdenum cofactor biosynthesis enzyme MoaA